MKQDLRQKVEKDVGLYTSLGSMNTEDQVMNLDFPRGWSAGNTALHLACQVWCRGSVYVRVRWK